VTTGRAVRNRLPASAQKLTVLGETGSWFSDNDDYEIEASEFRPDDASYRQVSFVGQVELTISSVILEAEDHLDPIEFVFAAKMQSGGQIDVVLSDTSFVSGASQPSTFVVTPQPESAGSAALNDLSWGVYRTEPVYVNKQSLSAPRIDVTVTIVPNEASDVVYFANPVLSGTLDQAYYSEAARQMNQVIPDHFTQGNGTENPPAAVMRFIDVAFSGMDQAMKAYRDYRFFTFVDGRDESLPETLSNLVWPSDAGLNEAKWLTQFTGTEPVAKLSSTLDPSNPFVLDTSQLNGTDTLRFSTTGVNDPPLGTVEVTRDFLRWQAEYGYYGMNAGSIAAVRESVKRVMVEPREVTIDLQHDGPFTVLVRTPWEQTYGASEDDVGEASPVVLEAIERARPIGVKITHELT